MGSRKQEVRITEKDQTVNGGTKLSKKQLIKQQQQKEKIKKLVSTIASIAIVIGIVAGVLALVLNKTPKMEGNISVTSEYFELDNAMMAYYMYDYVNQNYFSLYYYYGYNPQLGLKVQNVSGSAMSWFTYILNVAKGQVNELVALASEAKKNGVELDEEDYENIDKSMASLKASAKEAGYYNVDKYLEKVYVKGISQKTLRKCWELQQLATKYYNQLMESYEYGEEDYNKYLEENPESFYKFDYIYYEFKPENKTGATSEEKAAALAAAKAKAEAFLSKVSDEASFKSLIVELEKGGTLPIIPIDTTETAETAETVETVETDEIVETTEAGVAEAAEAAEAAETTAGGTTTTEKTDEDYLKNFIKTKQAYDADSDFGKWAFSDERKDGDIGLIEITNTYTVSGETTTEVTGYQVYYLTKAAYLDEDATKDVRHILFTADKYGSEDAAKAKAEEVLALYNKGEKTAEAFGELAKEYTEDSNGSKGGLYENVKDGVMVTEFNDWIFDEKRQTGDVEIVKTNYGYHIMYHVGDGMMGWQTDADGYLKNEAYTEEIEKLEKAYPVEYDNDKLINIP